MFGYVLGPFQEGTCAPSASPRMSHCFWPVPDPEQMMSQEYPPQLDPPDFLRIPNGPPEIPFELSERATFLSN
jgi:hypothetical protein